MELVGRAVKKEFPGLGIINGIVKSFEPVYGFFDVSYEDGDSEELDLNELVGILEEKVDLSIGERIKMRSFEQRAKKKRQRNAIMGDGSGNFSGFLVKDDNFVEPHLKNLKNVETLDKKCGEIRGNDRFDLNVDISMGEEGCCFDLNSTDNDAWNGNLEENCSGGKTHRVQHSFDINLGPEEEIEEEGGGDENGSMNKENFSKHVEETQLNASSTSLSEHVMGNGSGDVCLKEGNSSMAVEETELKVKNGLSEHARGDFCLERDEGIQTEDRDLGVYEMVIALRYEDKTCSKTPHKKRGRPRKKKSTTQTDEVIQSEDRDLGGYCRGVSNDDTSTYFHMKSDGIDANIIENCEDKRCSEPPDKEAHSRKKRGRPSKKLKTTTPAVLSSMEAGSSDMIFPVNREENMCPDRVVAENLEDKSCSEPLYKEADSRKKRGRPSKKLKSATQTVLSTVDVGSSDEIFSTQHEASTCMEAPDKEVGTRKEACTPRRRGRPSGESNSTTQTKLRRSTRRSSSTSLNHVSSMDESLGSNAATLSNEINVVLDFSSEGFREQEKLPPKLELPPSSKNLNIDEISVIDLFSVYSCLRSFSTTLFLCPFRLEAFLEALKDKSPNSLIDSIHYSILQTLKLHLEFLSDEGSRSAANCLRSLNWALLDLVTWPIYMVEYLLIHGSELKPGFELRHLKVLMDDYYTQSAATKLEILRCLCDDVFEAEIVKSEVNRRTQATELDMGVDRIANVDIKRKRKDQTDDGGGSCLTQDVDETADGNSDECCLCKMDGSLICCDGCPAAYHTRCVGITKDSLPEGEWFCPECLINRYDNRMKSPKSLRGAELLGTDSYGRLYFSTCGYLLVLDSCDPESSYSYYDSSDINVVFEVLKSSHVFYGSIINAISTNWGILGTKDNHNSRMDQACEVLDVNGQMSAMTSLGAVPLSEIAETKSADKPYEMSVQNENLDCEGMKISESLIKYDSELVSQSTEMGSPVAKSEALTAISNVVEVSQNILEAKDCLNQPSRTLGKSEISGETHSKVAECALQSTVSCPKKNIEAALSSHASVATTPREGAFTQVNYEPADYINCYTFGQTAASVAREIRKLVESVKEDFIWSTEEIISAQMRLISNNWTNFCWPNIQGLHQNAQQEDCGWCFSCRNPTENETFTETETCLFNMINKTPTPVASESGAVSLQSKESRRSHLFVVICHMLSIEERLSGLLSGPWKFAGYSETWRRSALKATDIATVKRLLLILESNLRRLALLPEWVKHVDCVVTMGSASHVLTAPVQVSSSKQASGRKRAKITVAESNSALICAAKSSHIWWRGGRVSRQLFNYKVLPHSLASKGGRQGGGKKLLGMLYPDGSEFAKRSKDIAWRASVEMSTSVSHLAYLVRELDSNIRWDDLENIQYFPHLSKESKKTMKLFKKVTIRRKCTEGTNVKYLLDFGKRRVIPKTVIRNGIMLEVSASERRKYWLEESLVPLHIMKAYEEKKLARTSGKMKPGPLAEVGKIFKKSSRKSGLLHLLSRVQKLEYYKCGHCKKDVAIRDVVSCQDCEGFFHKRHVRKSEHSSVTECTYRCQRCRDKIHVKKSAKAVLKKRKVKPQKTKKASIIVQRQCLPRKVKRVRIQNTKLVAAKKRKQVKSRNQQSNKSMKSKKEICWFKGRRTQVFYAYWHNGLRLTRNSSDARAVKFRESKLLLPSQQLGANLLLPKCDLCCEAGYRSTVVYVNCENCQEWFHGEAFGATTENSSVIFGFRCHKCRKRNPPICPYSQDAPANEVGLREGG